MLDTPFIDFGPGTPFGDEPDEDIIITATVAPAAEPLEDGDLLSSIANFATLDNTANYASSASPTIASVQWLVDGVDQAGTYALSAGQSVVLRVTDGDTPANFREWTIDASVAAIAPAQFGTGDWSLANDGVNVTLTVSTLPDDGGSALTDLEYKVNSGSWTSLGAATTGDYTITASEGDTVTLRAVNAVGNGTASASKAVPASFDPAVEFAGNLAAYWNFTEMSGLHTDLAGTVAVSAFNDPIGSANDLSGTGNRVNAQLTAARSTYVENGGKPGAYFAAAAAERLIIVGTPAGVSAQDELTVVVVAQSNAQAGMFVWSDGSIGGTNDYIYVLGSMSSNSIRAQATTGEIMVNNTTGAQTAGTEHVVFMEKSGTVGRHYLDNVLQETDPPSGSFGTWSLTLDGDIQIRADDGIIFAILVIRGTITTDQRNALHTWANDLAGIV